MTNHNLGSRCPNSHLQATDVYSVEPNSDWGKFCSIRKMAAPTRALSRGLFFILAFAVAAVVVVAAVAAVVVAAAVVAAAVVAAVVVAAVVVAAVAAVVCCLVFACQVDT